MTEMILMAICRLLFLFSLNCCQQTATASHRSCSWNNCPKWTSNGLNVHLIAHTHDDMGWLKNVDEYYYGSNKRQQTTGVQYILDSVISQLQYDPAKKFSYAETGFFWRWYTARPDSTKQIVQRLVREGQLEFIGGGWTQNDEAATHYVAIIDQMTLGLRWLNETFAECGVPRIAWQIDPFGHSREMASLFKQMDYEALFFARQHYLEKKARLLNKSIEFIWNTSDDAEQKLLTGCFYLDNYSPPANFCFDHYCADDPVMDQHGIEGYNKDTKINQFIKFVRKQAKYQIQQKHVMLTMGSDFQYQNAIENFVNLDKIIHYINDMNTSDNIRVFYSTPSCYVKALKEQQPNFPAKNQDFFPYASSNHSYWTGYFTSRPTLKSMIRESNSFLQISKQLGVTARLQSSSDRNHIELFKRAVALCQHHDAVTGTAKQAVTFDYMKRLFEGWMSGQQILRAATAKLFPRDDGEGLAPSEQHLCPLSNVSMCQIVKDNANFTLTVFNGQAKELRTYVRVPFYGRQVAVQDPLGSAVGSQVLPTFLPTSQSDPQTVRPAPYELLFPVTVNPLGYATYFVTKPSTTFSESKRSILFNDPDPESVKQRTRIRNDLIELTFDEKGLLSGYKNLILDRSSALKQEFLWYPGMDSSDKQPSGAYIFHPNRTINRFDTLDTVISSVITGELVSEVRQVFSDWVSQVIRLYKGLPYVEIEWTVGPIPANFKNDSITKEVITRYYTDIKNNAKFYTDANGRQIMQRVRNQAEQYTYVDTEPVAGNYYPVNSRIFIKDEQLQLTVLTDRSQAGASIQDGNIELMLHRRCFYDDYWGVDEALNETGADGRGLLARGRHWILLAMPSQSTSMHRKLALDIFHKPLLTYASMGSMSPDIYRKSFKTQFFGLTQPLPENVHLLTLEYLDSETILIRFEHIYQKLENSTSATVDLKDLFSTFKIVSMKELTLAANKEKADSDYGQSLNRWETRQGLTFTLDPMQIRTFQANINYTI